MDQLVLAGLMGAIGGFIRATVGLFKAMDAKMKIRWSRWVITVIISSLIGILTGTTFSFDPRLSILAGYAGTDILEGVYKSFKADKVYVKTK